ncbi:hypothetical protein [Patulibacter defluvii]|uniref:hypothetical protein n=1 Tax=Patulibacter defluvii TaxID=3095358 RepID=UPI002A74F191|nr:hypothetical protein [Patulibacter sp. DM4]
MSTPSRPAFAVPVHLVVAVGLLALAIALLPALRREQHLDRGQRALADDPGRALREARAAEGPATLQRARELQVAADVDLGRLADAERVLRVMQRRTPEDQMLLRGLFTVQLGRGHRVAARRTFRRLQQVDPRYTVGLGK